MNKTKGRFSCIRSIDPNDETTWSSKIYLTFDVDWAVDEIIEDTLSLCKMADAPITLFATHQTSVLDRLIDDNNVEIGLHPNFNPLLMGRGSTNTVNYKAAVEVLKGWFPDATSVRSHSLCFGSLIQTAYADLGITHDSSIIVPYQGNNNALFPWRMWDGLIRVPYFFCDYVTSMTTDEKILNLANRPGLKIFDFHPIHVFLNTESLDRYERTRELHQNPKELIKHRYEGYGTRNRLIELLELAKST